MAEAGLGPPSVSLRALQSSVGLPGFVVTKQVTVCCKLVYKEHNKLVILPGIAELSLLSEHRSDLEMGTMKREEDQQTVRFKGHSLAEA